MSNSIAVSLIEEKLSKAIRREWAREVNKTGSKVSDKNKFPSLLEFLLEQNDMNNMILLIFAGLILLEQLLIILMY